MALAIVCVAACVAGLTAVIRAAAEFTSERAALLLGRVPGGCSGVCRLAQVEKFFTVEKCVREFLPDGRVFYRHLVRRELRDQLQVRLQLH